MSSRVLLPVAVLAVVVAASSAAAQPPVRLEPIASTASFAVHVTHAGDARVFIAELEGRIHVWKPGEGLLPTPFLDISGLVDDSGDGGFFSVAFHPDYASNGRFFVSYTGPGVGGSTLESVIARYQVSASDPDIADPASAAVLLSVDQTAASHNNGQLAFAPDETLYVGFGDGGSGGLGPGFACRSQLCAESLSSDAFHGSILRIDVDQNSATVPFYGIPPDNPFAGPADGVADEIWAKGFRNPWRFSFDRKSGDLWIGDVGQDTREEVIREPAGSPGGANYGWPVMEGTTCHDPDPISPNCPPGTASCFDPAYTGPDFEYATGSDCSVTGGFVYRGTGIPQLRGDYVFGDFCSAAVWVLDPTTWTRSQLLDAGSQLISFGEDAGGELYLALGHDVVRLEYDGIPPQVPALGWPERVFLAVMVAGLGAGLLKQPGTNQRGSSGVNEVVGPHSDTRIPGDRTRRGRNPSAIDWSR